MDLTESIPGAALAVTLVNSLDEFPTTRDFLDEAGWPRRWLDHHGFHIAADAVPDHDAVAVRQLRQRFAAAFDASSEEAAVELLNGIMEDFGKPPTLVRQQDAWVLRSWPSEEDGLRFAAAFGAAGLLEAIQRFGWERFGRCDGAPCRCVYVDRTRNGRRRYCCQLCADRMAQAASRRRRRGRA
jgi:predicted RNA-binding Zn ribbon-like protein